jgi:hypothetical protein
MKNSSKLQRLGSSLSRDFPCLFTHHNFVIRLRDKINKAFYCSRLPRKAFGRPRWDDTQVNYWTRGDGWALSFSNTNYKIISDRTRSYQTTTERDFSSAISIVLDRTARRTTIDCNLASAITIVLLGKKRSRVQFPEWTPIDWLLKEDRNPTKDYKRIMGFHSTIK